MYRFHAWSEALTAAIDAGTKLALTDNHGFIFDPSCDQHLYISNKVTALKQNWQTNHKWLLFPNKRSIGCSSQETDKNET